MDIRAYVRRLLSNSIEERVRSWLNSRRLSQEIEILRLLRYPRYTSGTTTLLGAPTCMVDAASFLSAYRAIFEEEIFAFDPAASPPTIIDGGANVGLATLYWKKIWPEAEIVAFEPDPHAFEVLEENCQRHGCPNVTLIQKGLWSEDTHLQFRQDGADGGRVTSSGSGSTDAVSTGGGTVTVPVVRLSRFLDRPIDLLKLDIEGAEMEVLLDCKDSLDVVDHLFVEYHSFVGQEQRLDELLRVLRDSGFRVHIKPELVEDKPFMRQLEDYGMDQRLNIFGYRI